MYVYMYMYMHVCYMHVYLYMYMYMHVCYCEEVLLILGAHCVVAHMHPYL